MPKRYNLPDLLRGICVIGMVIYHVFVAAQLMGMITYNFLGNMWLQLIVGLVRFGFFFLAGTASYILFERYNKTGQYYYKQLKRIARTLYLAIAITITTALVIPENIIYFGVLHSLAFAMLMGMGLINNNKMALILAFMLMLSRSFIPYCNDNWYVFTYIAGFSCTIPNTFDYFPLLPWTAFTLLGQVYASQLLKFEPAGKIFSENVILKLFTMAGRRALLIYMVHIPVIFGLLWFVRQIIDML